MSGGDVHHTPSIDGLEWQSLPTHWNPNHKCKPLLLILPNNFNLLWPPGGICFNGTSRVYDQCLVSIDTKFSRDTIFWDCVDKAEIGTGEDIGNSIWGLFSRAGGTSKWLVHCFLKKFPHKGFLAEEVIPKVVATNFSSDWDFEDLWSLCCNHPNHNATNLHKIKVNRGCMKWSQGNFDLRQQIWMFVLFI